MRLVRRLPVEFACRLTGLPLGADILQPLTIHLLEAKVDIRVIQVLLGHKKLETTALYASVATELLREVISPLETLKLST